MKIVVLGGDGFCGWPTALELSAAGHDVSIVDNLSRRNIDNELEAGSLTPIRPIGARLQAWADVSNRQINFERLDVARDYAALLASIRREAPDCIVHFAEQRAAPYSMKSSWHKRYTVDNNLNATNNVCAAIVESGRDIHLVHLGTMGVYATADFPLPEGYLPVRRADSERHLGGDRDRLPAEPGVHLPHDQDPGRDVFPVLRQERSPALR